MLDLARCMRENGIDMPDPQFEGGRVTQRMGGARRRSIRTKMRKAEKACAKYREAIKPPEMSDEDKEKFKKAALAHSRCMREHGIDMPDPQFDENGGAQIRIGRGSGIDPERAEVPARPRRRAATRCRRARATTDGRGRAMKRLARLARRRRRRAVAAGVASSPAATRRRRAAGATTRRGATATVERRDLVDRENLAGTLGYADAGTLGGRRRGHADRAARRRAPSITRGHSLYAVDGEPAAFLLYGDAAGVARLRARA